MCLRVFLTPWGRSLQALRPGCEELAARVAEDNSADGSAAPGHKSPRWSAERRASRVISVFTCVLRRRWDARRCAQRLACRVRCVQCV